MAKKNELPKGKIEIGKELLMTFSNKNSLFSSKKIERFVTFNVFLVITIVYIYKNINTLTPTEFIEVVGLWLAYGGYNSIMNLKDKQIENPVVAEPESTEVPDNPDTPDAEEKN